MKNYAMFNLTNDIFMDSEGNVFQFQTDGKAIVIGKCQITKLPDNPNDPFYQKNNLYP